MREIDSRLEGIQARDWEYLGTVWVDGREYVVIRPAGDDGGERLLSREGGGDAPASGRRDDPPMKNHALPRKMMEPEAA